MHRLHLVLEARPPFVGHQYSGADHQQNERGAHQPVQLEALAHERVPAGEAQDQPHGARAGGSEDIGEIVRAQHHTREPYQRHREHRAGDAGRARAQVVEARDKKRRQHAIKEHRARGVATWEAERGQDEQRIVEARPQPLVRGLEDHVHQHAAADRDGEREQPVPLLQSREHDAECGAGSADRGGRVQRSDGEEERSYGAVRVLMQPLGKATVQPDEGAARGEVPRDGEEQCAGGNKRRPAGEREYARREAGRMRLAKVGSYLGSPFLASLSAFLAFFFACLSAFFFSFFACLSAFFLSFSAFFSVLSILDGAPLSAGARAGACAKALPMAKREATSVAIKRLMGAPGLGNYGAGWRMVPSLVSATRSPMARPMAEVSRYCSEPSSIRTVMRLV